LTYHEELLDWALVLVRHIPSTQASLRRAVSTAYYAVFHLLIAEATSNWSNRDLRTALGRAYDHGPMKQASRTVANAQQSPYTNEDPQVVTDLRFVADTFVQLQEQRHFADYNLTTDLDQTDAMAQVKSAEKVFHVWPNVRAHQIAQEYLVALVVRR
jgi:hypothetical protein